MTSADDGWTRASFHIPYSLPAYVALGGISVGLIQGHLLRHWSRRAVLWIPAAALGWALAGSTVFLSDSLIRHRSGITGIAGALLYIAVILLGGLLLGAVQALALRRMQD